MLGESGISGVCANTKKTMEYTFVGTISHIVLSISRGDSVGADEHKSSMFMSSSRSSDHAFSTLGFRV